MPENKLEENQSEVARILAQIRAEFESAQQGLSGLSQGTPQHVFITAKMEHIGALHKELRVIAGDEAMILIATTLDAPASEVHA
jgi:hypothetical protein